MLRAHARRAALVVAIVAMLAMLVPGGAGAATSGASLSASDGAVASVAHGASTLLASAADAVVGAVRPGSTQVARANPVERSAAGHAGGWAVGALLLALAGVALLVGVRRSAWRVPHAAGRAATAPRAPPALCAC